MGPSSWASTAWTISKVNHIDDNVLLSQALHTLVSEVGCWCDCGFFEDCIYMFFQVSQDLIESIHKIQNMSPKAK